MKNRSNEREEGVLSKMESPLYILELLEKKNDFQFLTTKLDSEAIQLLELGIFVPLDGFFHFVKITIFKFILKTLQIIYFRLENTL